VKIENSEAGVEITPASRFFLGRASSERAAGPDHQSSYLGLTADPRFGVSAPLRKTPENVKRASFVTLA
jgi:hypothetical protein